MSTYKISKQNRHPAIEVKDKDVDPGLTGPALGQAIDEARAEKVRDLLRKG